MHNIESLLDTTTPSPETGRWIPARPERACGLMGLRMAARDAWAVLTGKAEAVTFPKPQEGGEHE